MSLELKYVQTAHIFVADGTWFMPPNLLHVVAIIRSGGGGSRGGGGGAIATPKIFRIQLDASVEVTVGSGGTSGGTSGGESGFGDYVIPGGGGSNGAGALAPVGRGGDGGNPAGESVTGTPITLLAGGGGGGHTSGGASGLVKQGQTVPFPYTNNSGAGGTSTIAAGWPAGGGGTNRPGAAGCVTVLATTWIEVDE